MTLLADMPDQLLIEELARRARKRAKLKPDGLPWCNDCTHFALWTDAAGPIDHYNPCELGHAMKFQAPEDMSDAHSGNYGFFRAVCEDREVADET